MASPDTFKDSLPWLLSSPEQLTDSISVGQIAAKKQVRLYLESIEAIEQLPTTSGDEIAVFVSSDAEKMRSLRELEANRRNAQRVIANLRQNGVKNPVRIVDDYKVEQVMDAIADPVVGHLMFIGHTNRSTVFTDGRRVGWNDVAPQGHLKKSVGILGCAIESKSGPAPRFGYNLVDPKNGIVYGLPQGEISETDAGILLNYQPLPIRLADIVPVPEGNQVYA